MSDFTQSQLDALNKAIAQGVYKVEYEDEAVTYRSLGDMIRLRDLMRRDLGKSSAGDRVTIAKFSKGLG